MNVLIIYAHPNPNSFNKAILDISCSAFAERGAEIRVRDLYKEKFNPVLGHEQLAMQNCGVLPEDVRFEQQEIDWADVLVLIYPLWWFDRPAILKGWFDRVFTNGFAFQFKDGEQQGLLKDKKAVVIVTAGGTQEDFGKDARHLTRATTEGTLAFCGVTDIIDRVFYAVPMVGHTERQAMLEEVREMIHSFR